MQEHEPIARVIRALTDDRYIRLAALNASPLWDGVRRGHPHLPPQACAVLTEWMGGALLLQSRGLFQERLQMLLRSGGQAVSMVADAWPDGMIRGVLDLGSGREDQPWIAEPGLMQVMRSAGRGEPSIGKLPLVSGSISTQVEHYLQQSEQVNASVTLWCDPATGEAGGLLVEPLPQCPPERLQRLVDALEGLEVVPHWERDPEFLLRWINTGEGATILSTTDVAYRCRCSKDGLLNTLAGFETAQLEAIFKEGDPAEVRCDYCSAVYLLFRNDVDQRKCDGA